MDLESTARSTVFVEVRSKGILGALEHHLVFRGAAERVVVRGVPESGAVDVAIEASADVAKLEPPSDVSASDRERMLDNIRGKDVLDVRKWPKLVFRGRYAGTLEAGTLAGTLDVRGAPRKLALAVRGKRVDGALRFDAEWEGTQSDLGLKPYRALMGALQLHDWAKIRVEIELRAADGATPAT